MTKAEHNIFIPNGIISPSASPELWELTGRRVGTKGASGA